MRRQDTKRSAEAPEVIRGDDREKRLSLDNEPEEAMEHFGGAENLVLSRKAAPGNAESRLLVPFIVI